MKPTFIALSFSIFINSFLYVNSDFYYENCNNIVFNYYDNINYSNNTLNNTLNNSIKVNYYDVLSLNNIHFNLKTIYKKLNNNYWINLYLDKDILYITVPLTCFTLFTIFEIIRTILVKLNIIKDIIISDHVYYEDLALDMRYLAEYYLNFIIKSYSVNKNEISNEKVKNALYIKKIAKVAAEEVERKVEKGMDINAVIKSFNICKDIAIEAQKEAIRVGYTS